jgi:esterase/lipase superfamily enzyme
MHREYHRWFSHHLGKEMEMLVFGHGGYPLLVFPTSMGKFFEYEDRGMIGAIRHMYEQGRLMTFCVDSVDSESFYNKRTHPRNRIVRQLQYEQYLLSDVVPLIKWKTGSPHLAVTGASFGGYHAFNFAMRHPDVVSKCVTMGGAFDIRSFMHGYSDEDIYFNNPADYMKNLGDPWFLDRIRQMHLVLAAGENDICRKDNEEMSAILHGRGIHHGLHIWGNGTGHDWPWWHEMARSYFG